MENAITALRLTVDQEASPLFMGDGFINLMYESVDAEPSYPAEISFQRNPAYRLDKDCIVKAYDVVNRDRQLALVAALLAEGQVPSIPPHYRVLSLIRAVELLYPEKLERSAALSAYEQEFAGLGISHQQFKNAIPQLRTRCAHGRSRGRSNPEPFVGIGYNEPSLTPLLRLLRRVVTNGLKERYGVLTA